jgi:FkbM family methyltransferase
MRPASLKRQLANVAERVLGVKILNRHSLETPALMARFEAEHLRKIFDHYKIDCVFDVGANAGQYFKRIRTHGYRDTVISFEPIPELVTSLREIARNDGKLFIQQIALDRSAGERTFNIMGESELSSLHTPDKAVLGESNSVVRRITVEARTLNQVFATWKEKLGFRRPFLKLDTQGHDLAIIEGGLDVLSQFIGVQTELSVKPIYLDAPNYRDVLDFYNSHGFELSALVMNAHHFPKLFEMDAILLRA